MFMFFGFFENCGFLREPDATDRLFRFLRSRRPCDLAHQRRRQESTAVCGHIVRLVPVALPDVVAGVLDILDLKRPSYDP